MKKAKEVFALISLPLFFLILFLIVHFLWQLSDLPSKQVLIDMIKGFFDTYGLPVIFLAALIESFLLVGNYFPGGAVIFLGVITSIGNPLRAVVVVITVAIAFIISNTLNYILGRTAWYKILEKFGMKKMIAESKKRYLKYGTKALFISYHHPNLGAIMSTSLGILKMDFRKFFFYSVILLFFWSSFWGVLVYSLGDAALNIMSLQGIVIVFLIWIIGILVLNYFENKKK